MLILQMLTLLTLKSPVVLHQLWRIIERGVFRILSLPLHQVETTYSSNLMFEMWRGIERERLNMQMDNGQTIYNNRTLTTASAAISLK